MSPPRHARPSHDVVVCLSPFARREEHLLREDRRGRRHLEVADRAGLWRVPRLVVDPGRRRGRGPLPGWPCRAAAFPADPSLGGFDNIGGVLSVSPVLLERYLAAAERISRLAVGDATIGPAFASMTYDVGKRVFQDGRMGEDLPFGSCGGIAVRHHSRSCSPNVCVIHNQKGAVVSSEADRSSTRRWASTSCADMQSA